MVAFLLSFAEVGERFIFCLSRPFRIVVYPQYKLRQQQRLFSCNNNRKLPPMAMILLLRAMPSVQNSVHWLRMRATVQLVRVMPVKGFLRSTNSHHIRTDTINGSIKIIQSYVNTIQRISTDNFLRKSQQFIVENYNVVAVPTHTTTYVKHDFRGKK